MEPKQRAVAALIRAERTKRGWSQQELANQLDTTLSTVERWERGATIPNRTYQRKLKGAFAWEANLIESLLQQNNEGQEAGEASSPPRSHWIVPHRNPYFTGREDVIAHLRAALPSSTITVLSQAMSGLGGIGKTQIMVEYAYRYASRYQAVFWVQADNPATILASLRQVAEELGLPEQQSSDPDTVIGGVKRWLQTHHDWLLLVDNVEHVPTMSKILPERGSGHVIMTTRAQSVGAVANKIDVEVMNDAEGCLFLLHRSKRLALDLPLERATEEDRSQASQLVSLMDGLPLALDQAGAYLEETQCSLVEYLDLYQRYHAQLLDRRGKTASDHPDSVATTFLISFDHIKRRRPDVAALLRCCAFLPPDAIFADAISAGAPDLGPLLGPVAADPVRLLDAVGELLAYSFLRRAFSDTAWRMHRLLQVVLKDAMRPHTERKWARRVVQMTERIFLPSEADPPPLRRYEPYLPYVQVCADLIKRWAIFTAHATALLLRGGFIFRELGLYSLAQPLYKQVAELFALLLDPESRTTAHFLTETGHLYMDLGLYDLAQHNYLWALKTFEEASDTTSEELIEILSHVALVSLKRRQFEKAYGYCRRIVTIQDSTRAPLSPSIARCLSVFGHLAEARGDLDVCAGFHRLAKDLREQLIGPEHPEVAESLYDLTANALMRDNLAEARDYSQRALAISRKVRGRDHPTSAHYLDALAIVYREEGNYEQAEKLHLRARYLLSQKLEPNHLALIKNHHYLSVLYRKWGKDEKADREERQRDRLYARHPELTPKELVMSVERLAVTWREQGKELGANRLEALAAFLRKHLF